MLCSRLWINNMFQPVFELSSCCLELNKDKLNIPFCDKILSFVSLYFSPCFMFYANKRVA